MAAIVDKVKALVGLGGEPKLLTVFQQMNAETQEDVADRKKMIASRPAFNIFIGIAIIVNTVMIGVEVDNSTATAVKDRLLYFFFDFLFALLFFAEMLIRMYQLHWDYFLDPWNFFDYIVVVLNCADLAVSVSAEGSGGLRFAAAMRVIRLLRVVRNIRGLKMFYGLWIVIQAMLDSLRTMCWVALFLVIIIYCVAIMLTSFVGQDEYCKEMWKECDVYVGTIDRSMWTVVQLITFDAWASDIARPMIEVSPMGTFILIIAIFICTFGMLNVIIAVMVERTLLIAKESNELTGKVLEKTEQLLMKSMHDEFEENDEDGNAELDYDEFRQLIRGEALMFKLRLLGIQCDEAEDLFELMDADQSGSVSAEEFVAGLKKLRGPAKGEDLVQLICFCQKQSLRAQRFVERLKQMNAQADKIQERLAGVGKKVTTELKDQERSAEQNKKVWERAKERQRVIKTLDFTRMLDFPGVGLD